MGGLIWQAARRGDAVHRPAGDPRRWLGRATVATRLQRHDPPTGRCTASPRPGTPCQINPPIGLSPRRCHDMPYARRSTPQAHVWRTVLSDRTANVPNPRLRAPGVCDTPLRVGRFVASHDWRAAHRVGLLRDGG
jgi:hypothetical protein